MVETLANGMPDNCQMAAVGAVTNKSIAHGHALWPGDGISIESHRTQHAHNFDFSVTLAQIENTHPLVSEAGSSRGSIPAA